MFPKNILKAVLFTVLPFSFSLLLSAASFGPGRVQLIAGGGGEVLLDSPELQVALGFVALNDGPLTSVKFASRLGEGWSDPTSQLFTARLYSDQSGKPDRVLATASQIPPTAPGARAREAVFNGVTVRAGQTYHVVISMPGASADKQMSVNYFNFDTSSEPLDSYDMNTASKPGTVLTSNDGGKKWLSYDFGAVGAMAVRIGGHLQGWAYTNSYDARIWHVSADDQQVLMQNFKFTTNGQGTAGKVGKIIFALRPQGGLSNTSIPLRVRLLDGDSGKSICSVDVAVDMDNAGKFFPVEVPIKDVILKEGDNYVLSIDISMPVGATSADYLFIRTFTWGFGEPSLAEVSWQGAEHSLMLSSGLQISGSQSVPKVDVPFVLDYTPMR